MRLSFDLLGIEQPEIRQRFKTGEEEYKYLLKHLAKQLYRIGLKLNEGVENIPSISIQKLTDLYVISSCSYYEYNFSFMLDSVFDKLAKYLLDNYDKICDSRFNKSMLTAGTGSGLVYTLREKTITELIKEEMNG